MSSCDSYVLTILRNGKYPAFRSSLYMFYLTSTYRIRNSNEPISRYNFQSMERFCFGDFITHQRSTLKNYESSLSRLGSLTNQREFLTQCEKGQEVPKSLVVRLRCVQNPSPPTLREVLADRILYSNCQVDLGHWIVR